MRKFVISCVIIAIAFLIEGCAITKADWEKASQLNNITAYESFIREHPRSEYVIQAKDIIEQIEWKNARAEGTRDSLITYRNQYPSGRYLLEAENLLENIDFKEAVAVDSETTYREFLKLYPNGKYRDEANKLAEQSAYKIAKKNKSIFIYEDFLKSYPNGEFSEEIRMYLRPWEKAKRLGELVIAIAPKTILQITDRDAFLSSVPSSETDEKLSKLQQLLDSGADPTAVRIVEYTPGGKKIATGGFYQNGYLTMIDGTLYVLEGGNPGKVFPATYGSGLTLLEYCKENGLNRVLSLLKK